MTASSCPLCGAPDTRLALDGPAPDLAAGLFGSSRSSTTHGQILRCERCDFGFTRARPSEEELSRLYSGMDTTLYEAEHAGRTKTARRHLRFVNRIMTRPGRLLDVGCASGAFLHCAMTSGWQVAGVEPSSALAEAATRATLGRGDIQCSSLRDASFDEGSFDAITLWDVLEHVPDPIAFALACRRLLKPGGVLFVNVPDIGSSIARLLGRRWPLLLPEHLNYFNQRSLQYCLGSAGFRVMRSSSRKASFSVGYVLHRLAQHHMPGAGHASRWLDQTALSRLVVSVPLGESLTASRLEAPDSIQPVRSAPA